jgi:hypothetical protein
VVRSFVGVRLFLYLQHCSTDLLYMCCTKKTRTTGTERGTHHGHCKGTPVQVASKPCIARAPEVVTLYRYLGLENKGFKFGNSF